MGYADLQSEMPAPAAIEAVGALGVAIDHCTIAHSGGYAIYLGRGSQNNRISASEIFDMGAGGVRIGEPELKQDPREQNHSNEISDNQIHGLGRVYAAGVGIWILQSSGNHIAHNHVHDLYYTAISAGWTWGYGPSQAERNLIEFNHLHDIGRNMLSDMGGIYTLGRQPGTVIRNNLIHDVSAFSYGGWGIYTDEGSSDIAITDNIVYKCQSAGFNQHYGEDNIVRNNVIAFNRDHQMTRGQTEPHRSMTIKNNIIYFDEGNLLGGDWTGRDFTMESNLFFKSGGEGIDFAGEPFTKWRAAGHDRESAIIDPLFFNAENFDFRLRPGSPALKRGFQQIDMSEVGPRFPAGADAW